MLWFLFFFTSASQVRPQKSLELADFANNKLAKVLEGRDDLLKGNYDEENSTKFINGKPVFGPKKPEWLVKGLPNPHDKKRIQAGVFNGNAKATKQEIQSKEKEANAIEKPKSQSEKTSVVSEKIASANVENVDDKKPNKLETTSKKDLKSLDNKTATTNEIVKDGKQPKDFEKKQEQESSSDNESDGSDDSDSSSSQPPDDVPYGPNQPAIPTSELLELELIANDIDDESDFEGGPEAFGLGPDDDGKLGDEHDFDDDEDDDNEDEYGRTRGSLVPSQYASRIQEEIARLRATGKSALESTTSAIDEENDEFIEEDDDAPVLSEPEFKEKKRVRFSETIEIKRFEKNPPKKKPAHSTGMISPKSHIEPIKDNSTPSQSEALSKDEPAPPRVSRFKLERMEAGTSSKKSFIDAPITTHQHSPSESMSNPIIRHTVMEREPIPVVPPIDPNTQSALNKQPISVTPTVSGKQSSSSSGTPKPDAATAGNVKENTTSSGASSIPEKRKISSAPVSPATSASSASAEPKKKTSRFKVQLQESRTSRTSIPTSSRIEELESHQLKTDKEIMREKELEKKKLLEEKSKVAAASSSASTSSIVGDIMEKCTNDLDEVSAFNMGEKKSQINDSKVDKKKDQIGDSKPAEKENILKTEKKEDKKDSPKKVSFDEKTFTNKHKQADASAGVFDSSGTSINPALVHGLRSMFPQEVLDKANEYYENSLMSEEDFIKAHLPDDDNENGEGAEKNEAKVEETANDKKKQDRNKPILAETLVERENAPIVDGFGMGYMPDQQINRLKKKSKAGKNEKVKSNDSGSKSSNKNGVDDENNNEYDVDNDDDYDDDDDQDYGVSRHELLQEYQKIRQTLIYQTGGFGKSPEELEAEPVGEPAKRVSRFKMARLSNRRT